LERGYGLRQVARAARIDSGYLSRLGRGQRAPRYETASRLIAVLGLDDELANELLGAVAPEWDAER
jgi:hypothetical protein